MTYSNEFEQLWKVYPKRSGGNPKPRAYKAYTARLKEKVLYSDLQAGILRYYNYCRKTGILNTSFVMQMATFFSANTEAWFEDWAVPEVEVKETLEQKAARLGIHARPGESWEAFEKRVNQSR